MQVSTLKTRKYSDSSDSILIQSGFPKDCPTRGMFARTFKLLKITKFLQYTQNL